MTEGDTAVINNTCTVWESQLEDKDIIIISAEDDENITHAYLDERATRRLLVRLQKFIDRTEHEKKEIAKYQKMVSDNAKAKM